MRHRRRGMILVLVLVVIALLALAAGSFLRLMVAEQKAVVLLGRKGQAHASAESGVEMVRSFITQEKEFQDELGGWYDNELQFRGRAVVSDQQGLDAARFTIVAPRQSYGLTEGIRFGLEDESTRLNLHVLAALDQKNPGTGREILMKLPGMTEEIADSILDWMDEDEETNESGAEADYYSTLGYDPKNGPLETIEELLLVRGIVDQVENRRLLVGADVNRNSVIDPSEQDSMAIAGVDNSDGSMNRGWAGHLTLYSLESNLNLDGEKKIDLNQNSLEALYDQLVDALGEEEWATFIVAYRQGEDYDPEQQTGTTPVNKVSPSEVDLDFELEAKRTISGVLDLIGKDVKLPSGNDEGNAAEGGTPGAGAAPRAGQGPAAAQETILETPFPDDPAMMDSYLPTLMDHVAAVVTSPLAGRININQAPRTTLEMLGGAIPDEPEEMKQIKDRIPEIVDRIIAEREPDPTIALTSQRHETWILSEEIVTLEEMKVLMPFVCAGGCVYRAQVIGYFDQGGPMVRIETILDASKDPARIVFWRDISNLGRGYDLETLGVETDMGTAYGRE